VVADTAAHGHLVGAETCRPAFAGDKLDAKNLGGEADGAGEIGRADANAADVLQAHHGFAPPAAAAVG